MSNHTPTLDHNLITCAACSFRAVQANDGRVLITEPGDTSVDHLAAAKADRQQRVAWAEQAMDRLRIAYAERRALPGPTDNYDDLVAAECIAPHTLTLRQLQRLYRAVMGEHGV